MTAKKDRFIFMLGQARHALMTHLDRTLLKMAGITAPQASALFYLTENDGCLLSRLGKGLLLDRSAITGMVDRMEKKHLVRRENSTTDRRAIHVYLTEKGRLTAASVSPVIEDYNRVLIKGFGTAEVDAFRRILMAIVDRFTDRPDA